MQLIRVRGAWKVFSETMFSKVGTSGDTKKNGRCQNNREAGSPPPPHPGQLTAPPGTRVKLRPRTSVTGLRSASSRDLNSKRS